MREEVRSGWPFLLLVFLCALLAFYVGKATAARDTNPQSCAWNLLTDAGYGPAAITTPAPLPPEMQKEITAKCVLPYLDPATADTAR